MSPHALMLVICLVIAAVVHSGISLSSDEIGQIEQALQLHLQQYASHLEESAAHMHERYQRSRELPIEHHRSRRSGDTRHSYVAGTGVGNREELLLQNVTATTGTTIGSVVSTWKHVTLGNGDQYLATIQPEKVEIFQLNLTLDTPLTSIENISVNATAIEFIQLTNSERAGVRSIDKTFFVRANEYYTWIDTFNGTSLPDQLILEKGITDIEAFSINSLSYLAFSRVDYSPIDTKSLLYKWSTTFEKFELSQEISTTEANSVDSFMIGDNTYLVFAERTNKSLLCRYDRKLSVFKVYQRLDVVGDTHVVYFTSAYTHFLVFAVPSRNVSVIYKWQLRAFYETQELSTPNGNSWTVLSPSSCQDGTFLLLSSSLPSPDTLKMYQFSITLQWFAQIDTGDYLDVDASITGSTSATVISDGEESYIAVGFDGAPYTQASILQVMASIQTVKDPLQEEIELLQDEIAALTDSVDVYEGDVISMQTRLADAVRLDGDQEISGIKEFIGWVTINGTADVAEINVEGDANVPITPGDDDNLNVLEERLNNQTQYLANITTLLNNTVTLGTNQSITGHKEFTQVTIEGALVTGNLTADEINGHDIHDLHADAVRLDKAQTIYGQINFTHDVNITSDLNVTGQLNGLDLETDVVLTNKEQTITGAKVIDNSVNVTGNVSVTASSTVNGLDVSEQVVTLNGDYSLAGSIVFEDRMNITGNITTSGTIDGVDVYQFANDTLTTTGTQTIQGNVTFLSLATFDTNVTITQFVNDEDLSDIDARALKLTQNAQVTGRKTLNGPIVIESNLQVDETIDELDWPSNILTKTGNNTITGEKMFVNNVNVTSSINVTGSVDGLDLSEQVVTLSGNHSISGVKNFSSGVRVDGDVIVDGDVDGVDVAGLNDSMVTLSTKQTIQGAVTFGDSVKFQGDLSVDGLVSEVNITFLYEDAVFEDLDEAQVITAEKTFAEDVNVSSGLLEILGLVNGNNMTGDYLDKVSDQNITGQKTFADGLSVNANVTIDGLLHDVDLATLYQEAVLTWRDTNITGVKTFMNGVDIEGDLITTDSVTINGFDVSEDFMMTNRQQTVTGLKYFAQMEVDEDLTGSNLTIGNALNGRNWTDFITNRITLTTDQVITGSHVISNDSHVIGNVTVNGTVDDLHLAELADNVLYKSVEQTITGRSTFDATVSVLGDVTCDALVDGVNITDINNRAMFVDENQDISGVKTFLEDVTVTGELDLEGLLSGVDIVPLILDAVYDNDGAQYITASKNFSDGFFVSQNITVSGYVDGIDLSEQMLTKTGDQEILGNYTFSENVTITGNFEIGAGEINDVNITTLNDTLMRTNLPQTIESALTFIQDVYVEDDVSVSGLVDGVNLTDLNLNAVMLDEPVAVFGELYFTKPVTFLDDLNTTGLIHGLNFSAAFDEVVTIHTEQLIPGLREFTDAITVSAGLMVHLNMSAQNAFDRDLDEFIADAVLLQGDQIITGQKIINGDVHAQSDVNVTGDVNGIKVATEVVTLDGDQEIDGVKTFTKNITTNDNITITGEINNVDIASAAADTFMVNNPEPILAKKTFEQTVIIYGNVSVGGLVDGIDLSQEAVTLDTDQVVRGEKTFADGMTISGYVDNAGTLCDVNFTDVSNTRVSLSMNETLNATLLFNGHVTFEDDVTLLKGLDDLPLTSLQRLQDINTADTEAKTRELDWITDNQCMEIDEIQNLYYNAYADLSHLSEVQIFPVHAESFEHFTIGDSNYLAMARNLDETEATCIDSIIYELVPSQEYVEIERLPTRGGKKWYSFQIYDVQFLAIANSMSAPCAGDDLVANTVYIYNGIYFQYFQDIDGAGTNDIQSVAIGDDVFLAVANGDNDLSDGNSTIFIFNNDTRQFDFIQSISVGDATAVEFVQIGEDYFMILATSDTNLASVYIYEPQNQTFVLHHILATGLVADITSFVYQGQTGLIIANHGHQIVNSLEFEADLAVHYWSEDDETFVVSNKISIISAADVEAFRVGGYLYVAVVSQFTSVQLFRDEGSSGFVKILTQELNGVTSVEVYNVDNDFYLAVGVNPPDGSNLVYPVLMRGNVVGDTVSDVIDDLCVVDWSDPILNDPPE